MSTRFIQQIREQILCRILVMAHLHSTDEEHPLAYWEEVQLTWIQALQSDEWMQWRAAMLKELTADYARFDRSKRYIVSGGP